MSTNDLIASLRQAGELEARGEFKLDRDKAREKMQKFQLPDPQRYVLELVQAAYVLGAERVDFVLDADEMCVVFGGDVLSEEDLENLYNAPFKNIVDDKVLALRHLAIGLTAARALEPSVLTVESGEISKTFELAYDPEIEDETLAQTVKPWANAERPKSATGRVVAGTRIYLKERFRMDHLSEWFRNLKGELAECVYLEKHCQRTPIIVTLNKRTVSAGIDFDDVTQIPGAVAIQTEHETGHLVLKKGIRFTAEIHQNGVMVATHTGFSDPMGYDAVLESKQLSKDLSQAAFIEDDAWQDLVDRVLPMSSRKAIRAKYGKLERRQWGEFSEEVLEIFPTLVQQGVWADELDRPQTFGSSRRQMRPFVPAMHKFLEKMADFPIWPVASQVDRSKAVWIGDDILLRGSQLPQDHIFVSDISFRNVHYPHPVLLRIKEDDEFYVGPLKEKLLEPFFGRPVVDVTYELQKRQSTKLNRDRWKASPWTENSLLASSPVRLSKQVGGILVTLYASRSSPKSQIVVVKDGHLLRSEVREGRYPRGLSIVLSGDITPVESWSGPEHNEEFSKAVETTVAMIPEFMEACASAIMNKPNAAHQSFLLDLVGRLVRGRLHIEVFDAFSHFKLAKPFAKAQSEDSMWSLSKRANSDDPYVLDRVDRLGKVADAEIFPMLDGGFASFAQIREKIREVGDMFTLHEKRYESVRAFIRPGQALPFEVLNTNDETEVLLTRLLGDHFRPAQSQIKGAALARNFEVRPKYPFELATMHYADAATFSHDKTRIKLGMVDPGNWNVRQSHGIYAVILHKGRKIDEIIEHIVGARFEAVVDSQDLDPRADYTGILKNSKFDKLCRRLKKHADLQLQDWIERQLQGGVEELPDGYWSTFTALVGGQAEWPMEVECFLSAAGEPMSLRQVRGAVKHKTLYTVEPGAAVLEDLVKHRAKVIQKTHRAPLSALIDVSLIVDVSHTSENAAQRKAVRDSFLSSPKRSFEIRDTVLGMTVEHPLCSGRIALVTDVTPNRKFRDAETELHFQRRFAGRREFFVPFGRFKALLDTEHLEMNAMWTEMINVHTDIKEVVRDSAGLLMLKFARSIESGAETLGHTERRMAFAYLVHAVLGTNSAGDLWPEVVAAFKAAPLFMTAAGDWVGYDTLAEHEEIVYGARSERVDDVFFLVAADDLTIGTLGLLPALKTASSWDYAAQISRSKTSESETDAESGDASSSVAAFDPKEPASFEYVEPGRVRFESLTPASEDIANMQVMKALRELYVRARRSEKFLIDDHILDSLHVVSGQDGEPLTAANSGQFFINSAHPAFAQVEASFVELQRIDMALLVLLASSLYSDINRVRGEITDVHEARFQLLLSHTAVEDLTTG